MKTKFTVAVLGIMLGTVACQKEETITPTPAPSDAKELVTPSSPVEANILNRTWALYSLRSSMLIDPGEAPWFVLDTRGGLAGNTGCNAMSGKYDVRGNVLRFDPVLTTRIYCPRVMPVEEGYLEAVRVTDNFRMDAGRLVLLIGNHELARFQAQ